LKVTTRWAPTISGVMHIGTLYNCLLNYLFAKKNNGEFKIRLDGQHLTPERSSYQKALVDDLEKFGFEHDGILLQSDRGYERDDYYTTVFKRMLNERSGWYLCDCSVSVIANRKLQKYMLERAEKYPPPLGVYRLKALGLEGQEMKGAPFCKMEAPGFPISSIAEDNKLFWKPRPMGYMGEDDVGDFGYKFHSRIWITGIEIEWFEAPLKEYLVVSEDGTLCRVEKSSKFCYHPSKDIMYERNRKEIINFAPCNTQIITIVPLQYMVEVKREYCYDRFCRYANKKLDLMDRATVVRKIIDCSLMDVALWFGRQPDLCWTSVLDDRELGITHCIRGIDIEPFANYLELEASSFVEGYNRPKQIFHGMIVSPDNVKYSKFVNSPRIVEDVKKKEEIFGRLAYLAKLIDQDKSISLEELIKEADFSKLDTKNMVWGV